MFLLFKVEEKEEVLSAKEMYLNWVTIVDTDMKNKHISYVEDGALSPDKRQYVVDCVASHKDCKRLIKGERVLILYAYNEEGKWLSYLLKPKPNFQLHVITKKVDMMGKVYFDLKKKRSDTIGNSLVCMEKKNSDIEEERDEEQPADVDAEKLFAVEVFLVLASVFIFWMGYQEVRERNAVLKGTVKIEATVIEAEEFHQSTGRGGTATQTYSVKYEWNGDTYEHLFVNVDVPCRMDRGSEETIFVSIKRPYKVYRSHDYNLSSAYMFIGIGAICCGCVIFREYKVHSALKENRKQQGKEDDK